MLKAVSLAALLTATLATAGTAAFAGDHHRGAAIQPTSPQPIADVVKAGGGTVTGTVEKVAANWFVMTDGSDRIDVASRGFLPDGIQSGDQITVVGGVRQGAIQAGQIIRQDGTAFGRDAMGKHEGGRHGRDGGRDGGRDSDRDDD
ncbi:cytochrome c maturation protein CcmE [Azospirillum sp. TSO5]|uniref:cytochrome c maturation protein CcmE domain-containing protein n=1 Tax=Azospirillum sp. TSO5 TaxID=716760 RepID=UPI0011B29F6D|nr:cytochrome c maturation protein CcmE [Azospirillum sp. TSO5]